MKEDFNIKINNEVNDEEAYLDQFRQKLIKLKSNIGQRSDKEKIETPESMYNYLKGILEIAKLVIKTQSVKAGNKYEGLEERVFAEIESVDSNSLTEVLLREYVAKVSDIIGYDYKVMIENGNVIDEFGRTSHTKVDGIVDLNIRGNYQESYSMLYPNQSGVLQTIYDYSFIEEKEMAEALHKQVSVEVINPIIEKLSMNNEIKKSSNFDTQNTPVFIIFNENHKKSSVRQSNFESIMAISGYIDFFGMEGGFGEVTLATLDPQKYEMIKNNTTLRQYFFNNLGQTKAFNFSTEAVKYLLNESIDVMAVDIDKHKLSYLENNNQDLKDLPTNVTDLEGMKKTLFNFFLQTESNYEKMNIDYRNNVFVKNLLDHINNNPTKYQKGVIGFVGGALHSQGMSDLLENLGFRTLTVTSKKFDN